MFDIPTVAVSPVVRLSEALPRRSEAGRDVERALGAEPGPWSVWVLAGIDPALLDDVERVQLLQAWEKAARWVAAQHAAAVVAVAGREPSDRDDHAREHVRVALVGMGGTTTGCVDTARALAGPLRPVRDALGRGEVSAAHARVLATETAHLDPEVAGSVAARVLPHAAGRTPGQLRARVRRAVIAADPAGADAAAARAARERRVEKSVLPDAQAELRITGPAVDVQTVWTALDLRAARTSATDGRRLDQRRFDALVTLCRTADLRTDLHRPDLQPAAPDTTDRPSAVPDDGSATDGVPTGAVDVAAGSETGAGGGEHGPGFGGPGFGGPDPAARATGGSRTRAGSGSRGGRRLGLLPAVHLVADAATWAGLAAEPVELAGYGPIPAGAARDHFRDSTWRAVVADAVTGAAVAVSDRTYRPSARTSRLLHLRDRGCVFPGCTTGVWHCDADHGTPHGEGGCTDPDNCGLLCRRHHRLKTFTAWDWTRDEDGAVTWTDPHGRTWRRPSERDPLPARPASPGPPPPDEVPPF